MPFRYDEATDAAAGDPTVVMVHGFPFSSLMWQPVVQARLIPGEVLCPDLRGFGQHLNAEPCSVAEHAGELHGLLEHREVLPCVLCGLSMGGYVAMEFAEQFPDDVVGLMLLNTRAAADNDTQRGGRDRMLRTVRRKGTAGVAEQMVPMLLSESTIEREPALVESVTAAILDCLPRTIENGTVAMRERVDCTDAMRAVDAPVSVIAGELDSITPPNVMRSLHECFDDSEFHVIEGAGHLTCLEQPAAVAKQIARLVERAKANNRGKGIRADQEHLSH
ncbi:MAG: alpha/beta hydrolase [Planctomycetota bacterium]